MQAARGQLMAVADQHRLRMRVVDPEVAELHLQAVAEPAASPSVMRAVPAVTLTISASSEMRARTYSVG